MSVHFIAQNAVWLNTPTNWLLGVVVGALIAAYLVVRFLRKQPEGTVNPAIARSLEQRIRAWWMMAAILICGFVLGHVATVVLFGLISFWALREFITMTPTRRGDHRALFWTFFLFTPLQYVLVGIGRRYADQGFDFYNLYSIMIPVYASLIIPARIAFSGDHKRFLERTAKIQAGLLICVYALSYAPALLDPDLGLKHLKDGMWEKWNGSPPGLLFYFILVVQLGDISHYAWDRLIGKHVIAPQINASKTWEGFFGGVLTAGLVGTLLFWATPFSIWVAPCMAMATATMGFLGGMTMSAIKRDRGVSDYGTLVQGHAGVLDRIDSICFAAPVFFHLTSWFYA